MVVNSSYFKMNTYPGGIPMVPLDGKPWQKIMDLGIKILEDHGFEVQVGSGNLLGLVREDDGFIHHDTDLDIDVMVRDLEQVKDLKALDDALVANGFRFCRFTTYTSLPMQRAYVHVDTNIIFDLAFFYQIWGYDWLNVHEVGVFIRPAHSVSSTQEYKLNGSTYIIPGSIDRYLTGRFGENWKTPLKSKSCGSHTAGGYLLKL